jgi:transketolase
MFSAGRAYEMVRNTIGYPHLNVKVCASHGGISVGEDGASHQMNEDFALMRAIPGMVVMCPADDTEAQQMVKAAYEYVGPVYIRFSRAASPVIFGDDYEFKIGKSTTVREGKDISIIANGLMVAEALEAAKQLEAEGIDAQVINMSTIKPLDEAAVLEAAKNTGVILTAEEHSIIGGLGEAVSSFLAENYPVPVKRVGVNDEFGHSGKADLLLKQFGLSADNIASKAKELVNSKKAA